MEKLPQPGDIIDVSQFEKKKNQPKRSQEEIKHGLNEAMLNCTQIINTQLQNIEGAPKKLLDQKGHIRFDCYYNLYDKDELLADKKNTKEKKRVFLGVSEEASEEEVSRAEDSARMRDGNVSEEVIFLMLNKALRDQFVVARSCDYDDFENGTDLLLVDKNTGKTICAFDETVESKVNGNVMSRMDKKMDRAKSRLKSGRGMKVKYGVTFENDKMVLGQVDKIPPLFLALDKSDLQNLLQEMDFSMDSPISPSEKNVLSNLLNKMRNQMPILEVNAHPDFSLEAVKDFIQKLEGIVGGFN